MAETEDPPQPFVTRITNRGLRYAEDLLYALVALTLIGCAFAVLASTINHVLTTGGDGIVAAMESTLDSLLIVFILIELLSAVRSTLTERKLVAEPFLLVGIIATIKEIVVVSAFAEKGRDVEKSMLEVGVLGAVLVGLALSAFVLRRKEREPEE